MIIMANENSLKVMIKKLGNALGYYFQMRDNANVNDLQVRLFKKALENSNANEVQLQNFSHLEKCDGCVRRAKKKACDCE